MSNTAILLDKATMDKHGFTMNRFIEISSLGYYGFNNDLINDMVHFEIFPQVYKIKNKMYVEKISIFGVVEKLLEREMVWYKAVEANEEAAKAKKELEAIAMPIDELDALVAEAKEQGIEDLDAIDAYVQEHKATVAEPLND